MANRYHSRPSSSVPRRGASLGDLVSESWLALGGIALALIAVVALTGSSGAMRPNAEVARTIQAAVAPAERSLAAIEAAFGELCQEPVLIGVGLIPDCETGVITLPDDYFSGANSPRLRRESREYIAAAVTNYLTRLRQLPAIWDSLEAIEIRGHGAPNGARDGYSASLVTSQQRALATLLFLVGPDGVANEADRAELERLAIVSGSAFARPPTECPEATPECLPHWRRVEIRPVLSETLRRGDWARTVEDLRIRAEAPQAGMERGPTTATP
ncbi:MAG: hypothetical protein IPK00_19100 [Deltaproteobacteria bacterium]|nr:hypothetical protein [Deltaproteobacteria bacterium]